MIRRAMGILLIAMLPIAESFAAEPAQVVAPEVEKAVLSEDWAKVLELLKDVDANSPSPVARLIKGHACLAVNNSNDSLRLFASTLNAESRDHWQQWVDRFVESHKTNAIALYLQGDAFARRRVWNSASQVLDQALKLKPDFHLALNARGVVAHAVGNTIMARSYFVKASQAKDNFSDAFASRGALTIYENTVGGEQYFEKARRFSRDKNPVLPLIGLGSVRYGKEEYERAKTYFDAADDVIELRPLVQRNRLGVDLARLDRTVRQAKAVGTTLKAIEVQSAEGPIQIEVEQGSKGMVFAWSDFHITCQFIYRCGVSGPGGTVSGGASGGISIGVGGGPAPQPNPPPDPNPNPPPAPSPNPPPNPEEEEEFDGTGTASKPQPPQNIRDTIVITTIVEQLELGVRQQVATTSMNTGSGRVVSGGADSNPSAARSNRGRWGVSTVYGLLYAVQEPPETILSLTRSGKRQ
ncbi:MAG: tetratricopeptide repeat protein [Nitrospira sp.]